MYFNDLLLITFWHSILHSTTESSKYLQGTGDGYPRFLCTQPWLPLLLGGAGCAFAQRGLNSQEKHGKFTQRQGAMNNSVAHWSSDCRRPLTHTSMVRLGLGEIHRCSD